MPRELRPVGACGLSAELDRHCDTLQPVLWQAGDQSSSGLCAASTGAVLRGSETCGGTLIHKAKQHRIHLKSPSSPAINQIILHLNAMNVQSCVMFDDTECESCIQF